MGSALAVSLCRRPEYRLRCVVSRSPESAGALCRMVGQGQAGAAETLPRIALDLIWLTVPDRDLAALAVDLAALGPFRGEPLFVHASGALSIRHLGPLRQAGCRVAGLHPLQAVASRGQLLRPGIVYACEAESDRLERLQSIALDLGGRPFVIAGTSKAIYHAAAAVASNYLVVLADASRALFAASGMDASLAQEALASLMGGTLENVVRLGPAAALTGPVLRGDVDVVRRHLQAIEALSDRTLLDLYVALGRRTLDLAGRAGALPAVQAGALEKLLGGLQ
jgi:predicted short-subunit dehydrogenase-like oxidoreductase (DUF2520 family)